MAGGSLTAASTEGGRFRSVPLIGSFTADLYRPYLDLAPVAPRGNPQTQGLLLAIEAVMNERPRARLHGFYPVGFREAVVRQARLPEYDLGVFDEPASLDSDLRTPQWHKLVDDLLDCSEAQFVRVLWLLFRMTLHRTVLLSVRLRGSLDPEALLIAGLSKAASGGDPDFGPLLAVAEKGSWAVIEASYLSAALAGKRGDADGCSRWSSVYFDHLMVADLDKHGEAKLWSRYHRVRAMVPMIRGDDRAMQQEMDEAQIFAGQMHNATEDQRAEKAVLHSALWESRTREAVKTGDLALAEIYARRFIATAPLMPEAHHALGRVYVERKNPAAAIDAFTEAARLGPPGSETAWFEIGCCHEEIGDLVSARDAYVASLDLEPYGFSAAARLADVARKLDDHTLSSWATRRTNALEQMKGST